MRERQKRNGCIAGFAEIKSHPEAELDARVEIVETRHKVVPNTLVNRNEVLAHVLLVSSNKSYYKLISQPCSDRQAQHGLDTVDVQGTAKRLCGTDN